MNATKFFTKKSFLLLGLGIWAMGMAEDVKDGKYWYTAKPNPVAVERIDQIKLYCHTRLVGDSVLWKIEGESNLVKANPLLAKKDVQGAVYYKTEDLWQVDTFSFQGIHAWGDTVLYAPYFEDAKYVWRRNGNVLPLLTSSIWTDSSGNYSVEVYRNDATHDTLRYSRVVTKIVPGSSRSSAIKTTLIGQDLNHFWIVDTLYQQAEWAKNGVSFTVTGHRYLLLEDASLSILIFRNGKWYKDEATFYGIRRDGHLLRANVSAAKYQWYRNGSPVGGNSSFVDVAANGTGNYSLEATFITSKGEVKGVYFDFTKEQLGTLDNPISGHWLKRTGNKLVVVPPANFTNIDFVFWKSQTVGGALKTDSISHVFELKEPATVTALVLSNGLWYRDMGFFDVDSTDQGSFEYPFETVFVEQQAFELSVSSTIEADSILWIVQYADTTLGKNFVSAGASIELLSNAHVTAMVKANGFWYRHTLDFTGIVRDSESGVLHAPTIKNAQYEWFLNGNSIGVHTASYKPTVAGTYTVVIIWDDLSDHAAANERVAHTLKKAVFAFVVDALTGVEEDNQVLAALSLYPNPAQESFVFEGNMQSIDYRIEDVRSVVVKQGQTAAGVAVSVQDLQPGIYMVHMKTGLASATKRLVVR